MRADRSEAATHTASSTPSVVARIDMAKKIKAVVLGVGAEKGLGAAASRRFAKEGYHVLVAGRTAAKVGKVAGSDVRWYFIPAARAWPYRFEASARQYA